MGGALCWAWIACRWLIGLVGTCQLVYSLPLPCSSNTCICTICAWLDVAGTGLWVCHQTDFCSPTVSTRISLSFAGASRAVLLILEGLHAVVKKSGKDYCSFYETPFVLCFHLCHFSGQILHTDVVYLHGSGRNREADKLRHLMVKHRYYNSETKSLSTLGFFSLCSFPQSDKVCRLIYSLFMSEVLHNLKGNIIFLIVMTTKNTEWMCKILTAHTCLILMLLPFFNTLVLVEKVYLSSPKNKIMKNLLSARFTN